MITMMRRGDNDRFYAVVRCDHCGLPINKADRANCLYIDDQVGTGDGAHYFPVVTVHKTCTKSYQQAHPAPTDMWWRFEDMTLYFARMCGNLHMDWGRMQHNAEGWVRPLGEDEI